MKTKRSTLRTAHRASAHTEAKEFFTLYYNNIRSYERQMDSASAVQNSNHAEYGHDSVGEESLSPHQHGADEIIARAWKVACNF